MKARLRAVEGDLLKTNLGIGPDVYVHEQTIAWKACARAKGIPVESVRVSIPSVRISCQVLLCVVVLLL